MKLSGRTNVLCVLSAAIITAAAFLLSGTAGLSAANLVANPLFEQTGADGNPSGWSVPARWPEWTGEIELTGQSFKGARALMVRLSENDRRRRIEQRIRGIERHGEHEFSFYTRISGEASVSAFWAFLGQGGREIRIEGQSRRIRRPVGWARAAAWTRVSDTIDVPEGTTQIILLLDCWLDARGEEAVVFFDDVSLTHSEDIDVTGDVLPAGAELVLEEDFSAGVIPEGWEIADREWEARDGALHGSRYAKIYYTAGVGSPNMRVEYTAWADGQPGDLSAALSVREPGPWSGLECYYFGFGARLNTSNTIVRRMRGSQVIAEQGGVLEAFEDGIRTGEKHRVVVQRNYNDLRLYVDGKLLLEGNDPFFSAMDGEIFGFILDNPGSITDVRVYALPWEASAEASEREIEFKVHEGFENYTEGGVPGVFAVEKGAPAVRVVNRPTWVYSEPMGSGTEYVDDHCMEVSAPAGGGPVTLSKQFPPLASGIVEFDVYAEDLGEFRFAVGDESGNEIINLVISDDGRFMQEDGKGLRVLRESIRYQRRRFDADFRMMEKRWYTFRLQFSGGFRQIVLINHYSEIKGGFQLGLAGEYLPLGFDYSAAPPGGIRAASFSVSMGGGQTAYLDNLFVFGPIGTDTVNGRPLTLPAGELLGVDFPGRKDPFRLKTYSYRNVTDSSYRMISLSSFAQRHRAPGHEQFREAGSLYNELIVDLVFFEERINMLERSVVYVEEGPLREGLEERLSAIRLAEAEALQEEALELYALAYLSDMDTGKLGAFYAAAEKIKNAHNAMDEKINSALEMLLPASGAEGAAPVPAPRPEGEIAWNAAARRWERDGDPAAFPYLRRVLFPYWFDSFKLLGYPKHRTSYYSLSSHGAEEGQYIEKFQGSAYDGFRRWERDDRTGLMNIMTGIHYATTTAPEWWVEKHKDEDIIFVRNDGSPFDSPLYRAGNQYMLNYWHPAVKNLIGEQFAEIGRLADEHKDRVDFIRIGAEIKNLLPGSNQPGYNPTAIREFQKTLRVKYRTISNLNRLWNTDYRSFDEIQPPRHVTAPSGLQYEFRKFMHQGFNDWLRSKTDALNEQAPDVPVALDTQYTFGGSLAGPALDPVGFFRAANARWYHTYQDWDRKFVDRWHYQLGSAVDVPWGTHEWGVAQGSPYMFQLEKIRNNGLREKFMQMMWGASMFDLYGNLHGNWQYAPGLQDYRLDYVVFTYKAPYHALFIDRINRLGREALTIPAVKPAVGILESASSYYNGLGVREAMRPLARRLADEGWDFEFLYEQLLDEGLQTLEGTEVLLVPQGICMSAGLAEAVYGWVREGGVLIAIGGPAGIWTEHARPSGRLEGVFRGAWKQDAGRWALEGDAPFFEEGGASAWESAHGAGKVVVFDNISDKIYEVMGRCTEKRFGSDNPEIQFCMREKDGVKHLYALNWSVYDAVEAEIFVRGRYGSIVDRGLQVPLEVSRREEDGMTYFRTRLAPGEGTLFRLLPYEH